jgi:hypothetical protein
VRQLELAEALGELGEELKVRVRGRRGLGARGHKGRGGMIDSMGIMALGAGRAQGKNAECGMRSAEWGWRAYLNAEGAEEAQRARRGVDGVDMVDPVT